MARVLALFPSALYAASQRMSQAAFERYARSLGMGARNTEMRELFRIAQGIVARSPESPYADPFAIPAGNEVQPWPTKSATGVRQNVVITYRDRTTGKILKTYYSVHSENGIARDEAVAKGIDAYASHADRYNQDLIGAIHTSSYRNVPFGV
jgi:hypothetical protein